jgi:hypothetical protein
MAKFSVTNQIPCSYGLDELPTDIIRRELLYFFQSQRETVCTGQRAFPRPPNRSGDTLSHLSIHWKTPILSGKYTFDHHSHVADSLKLDGEVIPLKYSDRERTRHDHIKIAREFMEIDLFHPANHQGLTENLIQNAPDPGPYTGLDHERRGFSQGESISFSRSATPSVSYNLDNFVSSRGKPWGKRFLT